MGCCQNIHLSNFPIIICIVKLLVKFWENLNNHHNSSFIVMNYRFTLALMSWQEQLEWPQGPFETLFRWSLVPTNPRCFLQFCQDFFLVQSMNQQAVCVPRGEAVGDQLAPRTPRTCPTPPISPLPPAFPATSHVSLTFSLTPSFCWRFQVEDSWFIKKACFGECLFWSGSQSLWALSHKETRSSLVTSNLRTLTKQVYN